MAVTFVQSIGAATPGDAASQPLTTSATAAVGERIVAVAGWFGTATLNSVADSSSNTYAIDLQTAANSLHVAVVSCDVTTQLASGGTITFTFSESTNWANLAAMTLGAIATSSYTDGTGTFTTSAGSGSWNTSDSTTTVADALIVGAHVMRDGADRAHTAGTNMTEAHELKGGNLNFATVYRVLTATGAFDASGSWSGSDNLAEQGGHVVYKGVGGGAAPRPKNLSLIGCG